jgi:beta-aspartyl-peptidase (threonine type)
MNTALSRPGWSFAIHGGAGAITKGTITPEQEKAYRHALESTLALGRTILADGGTALDAVESAVRTMEDNPLFNAGRGAVFTAEGRNELDAAIMDGETLSAGAVAGITRTRHPITLARAVMESGEHVMLVGEGAEQFSREQRLEQVEPGYFSTERRWKSLQRFLSKAGWPEPQRPKSATLDTRERLAHDEGKFGTVGAVALDRNGHVASATSTGGITGKRYGRVGDSPIIGAGCYASDRSCAVSCTGDGEYFIRLVMAHSIATRVRYRNESLQAVADTLMKHELNALGGKGGVIALAPDGQVVWSFNTEGMYRARASENMPVVVSIYGSDI